MIVCDGTTRRRLAVVLQRSIRDDVGDGRRHASQASANECGRAVRRVTFCLCPQQLFKVVKDRNKVPVHDNSDLRRVLADLAAFVVWMQSGVKS
jgi:hypothetical protein